MARAMPFGFRSSLAVIAGIVLGDVVFLLLAVFGLSVAERALGELFILGKLGGGFYLIWLGIKIWNSIPLDSENPRLDNSPQGVKGFISGLLVTLSNPKVILFIVDFCRPLVTDASIHIRPATQSVTAEVLCARCSCKFELKIMFKDTDRPYRPPEMVLRPQGHHHYNR